MMMRLIPLWLAALAVALAAGCGPGVGGTGTGETGVFLDAFGASPRPLCDAPFADRLDCRDRAPGGEPAPSAGTSEVKYAETAGGTPLRVVFAGDGVVVEAPCLGLEFGGAWGAAPGGETRFFGSVTFGAGGPRELAQLSVDVVPGAPRSLRLLLQADDGRVILGPQAVEPATSPPAAGCN